MFTFDMNPFTKIQQESNKFCNQPVMTCLTKVLIFYLNLIQIQSKKIWDVIMLYKLQYQYSSHNFSIENGMYDFFII